MMDREIPKEVLQKEQRKKWFKVGAAALAVIVAGIVLNNALRSSVDVEDITLSTVDKGTIEVSVSAQGKVVPAVEEIINTPIATRILEVYRRGGDSVFVGTPILKLDLQSTETDFQKLVDQERMKVYELEQLRLNNQTFLNDLAMKVEVAEMKLHRLQVELRNERYLDSIGSGTTDKVREVELACNTGKLELQQLRQQLDNERQVKAADLKVKELELSISNKSMAEMKRTLEDAQIRSPREGILTYINTQVGAQVPRIVKG